MLVSFDIARASHVAFVDLCTDQISAVAVQSCCAYVVTKDDHEQFNSNIMWAKGKTWASVRSATEPLFHTASLNAYGHDMHESIGQWLTLLKKLSAGEGRFKSKLTCILGRDHCSLFGNRFGCWGSFSFGFCCTRPS